MQYLEVDLWSNFNLYITHMAGLCNVSVTFKSFNDIFQLKLVEEASY